MGTESSHPAPGSGSQLSTEAWHWRKFRVSPKGKLALRNGELSFTTDAADELFRAKVSDFEELSFDELDAPSRWWQSRQNYPLHVKLGGEAFLITLQRPSYINGTTWIAADTSPLVQIALAGVWKKRLEGVD
jgi:hypothetical protein